MKLSMDRLKQFIKLLNFLLYIDIRRYNASEKIFLNLLFLHDIIQIRSNF